MNDCSKEKYPYIARILRNWKYFNSWFYLKCHEIFYSILFKLKIGRTYQVWLCKKGLYRRYPDGRCMWCGGMHHYEKIREAITKSKLSEGR